MLLNPNTCHRQAGFTVVEVMISMAILVILTIMAIPNFQSWIINGRIRATASTLADGLRQTRAEAIKRNSRVSFQLCGKGNSIGGNSGVEGSDWIISLFPQTGSFNACEQTTLLDQESGAGATFSSGGTSSNVSTPLLARQSAVRRSIKVKSWSGVSGQEWSVSFNGMGRVVPNPDAQTIPDSGFRFDVTLATEPATMPNGVRSLAVLISPYGQISVCDPGLEDSADPRYCPR